MRDAINTLQPLADKAAIGLSLLCVVHCLALPLAVALLPSLVALGFADEAFHLWMVFFVIPLSAFALTLGCRKHNKRSLLYVGFLGLAILCLTALFGHDYLGETGERVLTLVGATIIAWSHVQNFLLCRQVNECACPD